MKSTNEDLGLSPFRHTQYALYLTVTVALSCVFYDSTHGIMERYHINRKWFYLYGIMCLFAYLYTRPMIRRRLGSASAGYINWSSVYVVWLCAAVFYHLPSLESMGLDVKADISMALTVFLLSLLVLGGLATLHGIGVVFNMVAPRLLFGNAGAREVFSAVILNAFNFSIATSTFYSFCGNAADHSAGKGVAANDGVRAIICGCWLHPLSASQYPAFTR